MLASQGGPSICTRDLLDGLNDIGVLVDLLSAKLESPAKVNGDEVLGEGRSWMKLVNCDYDTALALSKNIDRYLRDTQYDLYHANTLWLYPTHATCRYARKLGKPYVISTHGMLYPTALKVSRWKKKLMGALWYNLDIMNANCIHATCLQELDYIRDYGYNGPIAVIPNPVVLPDIDRILRKNQKRNQDILEIKSIGFLGRLDPIKKVENIIYAMASLNEFEIKNISFQVMGKFDDKYEEFLKSEVKRLNLEGSVEFVGFVSGPEKYLRLSELSALMVPSEQENFGMIIPEALICGTPVYASLGTPWSELNERGCGWWKDNTPETIAMVIREILTTEEDMIRTMGNRGLQLVREKYEQHKVAGQMRELYEWVITGSQKPEFVHLY